MQVNPKLKVLFADDHQFYLDGIQSKFKDDDWFEFVGTANTKDELLALNKLHKPDFVFTDIAMPDRKDGIEAIFQIKKKNPKTKVVALTFCDRDDTILRALEAGADAYLLKNVTIHELAKCIVELREGKRYYSREIYFKLKDLIARNDFNPYSRKAKLTFNKTELKVIELICEEHSTEEIAKIINLSQRTIEGYRSQIIKKMGVKNSVGITIYAIQNEIVKLESSSIKKIKNIWID
ncbi:MAG: hypothetical protein RL065_1650 [Bacteroidota bacterium]|jgi:DNA-binding NarL/FixJ family response regulator